jgi:hypothetical protein
VREPDVAVAQLQSTLLKIAAHSMS